MQTLNVLWTSDNKETFLHMLSMYTINAKKNKWWEELRLIIWGPSAKLASEDEEVQELIAEMIKYGIVVEACRACADRYEVAKKLENLGIDVKYMGIPLTHYIKRGEPVLSI